jgi:hypothetical protein
LRSWLLDSGERRYFFAGDIGYFHGFAGLRRRFAPIDVALQPIGAYEPRWFMRYQHMDRARRPEPSAGECRRGSTSPRRPSAGPCLPAPAVTGRFRVVSGRGFAGLSAAALC